MKLKLSARQKVAILMVTLPQEISVQILREFNTMQAQEVAGEIARLPRVSPEVREEVIREFLSKYRPASSSSLKEKRNFDFPGKLLYKNLLEEGDKVLYKHILDREDKRLYELSENNNIRPLEFLKSLSPREVASLLKNDHPQTIALVLYYIPSKHASKILKKFRARLQIEVAGRLAKIQKVQPEILNEIETVLQKRLRRLIKGDLEYREIDGRKVLINILSMCDKKTEDRILKGIMRKYPCLAKELKEKLCTFSDLEYIDDRGLKELLRLVDIRSLVMALKGAGDKIINRIFECLSEKSAQLLEEDLNSLSYVSKDEVKASRQEIKNIMRGLIRLGKATVLKSEETMC